MRLRVIASGIPATAHHSISMFDLATPIWVKGTLVRLDRISPHAILTLEERIENGKGRRWTAEGPTIQINRHMANPCT